MRDGVCDDGGPGSSYSACAFGTDCTDCGGRDKFPPFPPPVPPQSPPIPPPAPPPPSQLTGGGDEAFDDTSADDQIDDGSEEVIEDFQYPHQRFQAPPAIKDDSLGQYFGGAIDALPDGSRPADRYLDWQSVPVSWLGRGISYSSDFMAQKQADTPNLPWYGYSFDGEDYGVWARGPSRLVHHAGFMLSLHEGFHGGCPLLMSYLRPDAQLWRLGAPPFAECCAVGTPFNRTCLPPWLQATLAPNQTALYAPGVVHDPDGSLPARDGNRSQHFAIYYSTAPSNTGGLACIGRVSGRWVEPDVGCAPVIAWEDDEEPVLCSNSAASKLHGHENVSDVRAGPRFGSTLDWRASADAEALAYGAEPFYGFDGSLYMVYGAREPGDIRVVQLNESSGRLPAVAQPAFSGSALYHRVAAGPDFQLGPDLRAPPFGKDAYLGGKVRPHGAPFEYAGTASADVGSGEPGSGDFGSGSGEAGSGEAGDGGASGRRLASSPQAPRSSLVQNAFMLPRLKNGSAEYFLFVEWFDDGVADNETNASLARVYVGRSTSPTGPFYDRIGNDMRHSRRVVIGAERRISIESARWGANCNGEGYDVSAVAKLFCQGQRSCDWAVKYNELVPIDPDAYSDYDNPITTVADQYTDTPDNLADHPGCRRELNVTYRCTKDTSVLYESETRGELKSVFLPAEAADGSIAAMYCETPESVLLPGGSLFADPQRLGGNLHFLSLSHSAVFTYAARGSVRYAFTFEYQTSRSAMPEFGARHLRFTRDGWPVLKEDTTADWATCAVPEATYSRVAPSSYFGREAHYDAAHRSQAHYGSSSSTQTHCTHHSLRGSHCVGSSLRATHPEVGTPGPSDTLHGTIDQVGSAAWWREQEDHCNPLVETILGKTLHCTRFEGSGDLPAAGHVSTMERIRGCPQLLCQRTPTCDPDLLTRAIAGDTCTNGYECKELPQLRVRPWDSRDFYEKRGVAVVVTRRGLVMSRVAQEAQCNAAPHVSRIDPVLARYDRGTALTVFGTGFGEPARCRFGWRETSAINVTAHQIVCVSPALNLTTEQPWVGAPLLKNSFPLEVSMMSTAVLERTPLTDGMREARGENFTDSNRLFEYYDPSSIAISFVQPMGGPSEGSTHIDLHGAGFMYKPGGAHARSNAKCRFELPEREAVLVPATFHNSFRISCFTPAFPLRSVGTSWIEAGTSRPTTGDEVLNSGLSAALVQQRPYYDRHLLAEPLHLTQSEFDTFGLGNFDVQPSSYVKAGGERFFVPVVISTATEVASLQITFDGQHFLEGDGHSNFTYFSLHNRTNATAAAESWGLPSVAISGIHPHGGPSRGGTMVTLFGRGFAALDNPSKFEQMGFNSQDVRLRPERDTITFPTAEGSSTYTRFDTPDTDPLHDPVRHLLSPAGLFCLFSGVQTAVQGAADSRDLPITREYIVATAESSEVMYCRTPAHPEWEGSDTSPTTVVPLEIMLNGNRHEATGSGLAFTYYRDQGYGRPKLQSVHPSGGPYEGGTVLNISGTFLRTLGTPVCRFGNGLENDTVPATLILDEDDSRFATVRCVSPPLSPRRDELAIAQKDVALSIAQNGQDYIYRPLRFNYFARDKLVVSALRPSGGPERGGTAVELRGRHLGLSRGGLQCQFGDAWTAATAIDEDRVRCLAPAQALASEANLTYAAVDVRIIVNADPSAYSYSAQPYVYFAPLPALAVSSIAPEAGLTSGGTSVTLSGRGFRDLGGVHCVFGVASPVPAEWPPPPPPPRPLPGIDGDLRLANGGVPSQGRVEIYHDGQWGTICDDFWDLDDARVVCRQLGFPGALNYTLHGFFGPGGENTREVPIWLDNVRCGPFEERLDRCSSHGWGIHNCDHHEDAGVICEHMPDGSTPSPPPVAPPTPQLLWERLDDFRLLRGPAGAHLDYLGGSALTVLEGFNATARFDAFVCRSPPLDEALGRHDPRAVVRTVDLVISINGGDTYGTEPRNFTYYPE